MFSGIIERVAPVESARTSGGSRVLRLATGWDDLALGESIAVNGVCLTVAEFDGGSAAFFVSPETLARSNLGGLEAGSQANLERSVSLDTRLSGHLVQGHVDGMAQLSAVEADSEAYRLLFTLSPDLARFCVEKGSIALNGISLTLNSVEDGRDGQAAVGITIIPHTWKHTNLHAARIGDAINVEVDVIAKYVERLCRPYPKP